MHRATKAIVAAVLAALIALPATAGAITSTGTMSLVAATQPDVFRTETSQPAGNLVLRALNGTTQVAMTVTQGEQIVIEIEDAANGNCKGATSARYLGFTSIPDITASTGPGVEVSAALRSSTVPLRGSDPCSGFLPATQDQLVLTVTQAPAGGGTLNSVTIRQIRYDVGGLAATGPMKIMVGNAGGAIDLTSSSNAAITNLEVTGSTSGAIQPGANHALAPVTFRETEPDA
ncbi:MAG: hypothetical protein QOH68_1349, partial [Nocardioidaceae bacterium]|nr:hypothetical protein [Nocardioidaceae bacterium]